MDMDPKNSVQPPYQIPEHSILLFWKKKIHNEKHNQMKDLLKFIQVMIEKQLLKK